MFDLLNILDASAILTETVQKNLPLNYKQLCPVQKERSDMLLKPHIETLIYLICFELNTGLLDLSFTFNK